MSVLKFYYLYRAKHSISKRVARTYYQLASIKAEGALPRRKSLEFKKEEGGCAL